jgi:hypothetical protein
LQKLKRHIVCPLLQTGSSTEGEYEYYEEYEDMEHIPTPPPDVDIQALFDKLGLTPEEMTTTERPVPTLQVEEVTLAEDVTIAHR